MGTINTAFSIITGALDADQAALGVVANNVANANTAGYTEETANFVENSSVTINGVSYGDGVTETGATSQRDLVLNGRIDQQQQLASASSTRLAALDNIQDLFTPDSGTSTSESGDIGNDITTFFDSFSSLEAEPTSDSLRQEVLTSAQTLASDISSAASSLGQQQQSLNQEAVSVVSQVNALTTSLAQLNQQITSTSPDADAGTLEDQRQEDLSQLSQLVGINQITTQDNGLTITTTSGQVLVAGNSSYQITTGTENGEASFYVNGTNITSGLTSGGGELGGYLTASNVDIPSAISSLDQLAYSIETTVNQQQSEGTDLNGNAGAAIFAQPTQVAGSALSMSVVMTDGNGIAAAAAGSGADSSSDSNAVNLANLANESMQPSSSTSFSITQNLSSATAVGGTATGTVEVYDQAGTGYAATVTYTNEGGGLWDYSVALPDTLTADTSVSGQVSYTFGTGETVDPGTSLTITGTAGTGSATITAPAVTAGESVSDYAASLTAALGTAGISGVTVTASGQTLTIAGATATSGSMIADAAATGNTGTLQFNAAGELTAPASDVSGIQFSGLSDGAPTLNLTWQLYGSSGTPAITQTADATAQTAGSQTGYAAPETPSDFYSNFVSNLGSLITEVTTENTAQTASVTQLTTENNALSEVNLNDEAGNLTNFERTYQAASQFFTIMDAVMSSAINLGEDATVS